MVINDKTSIIRALRNFAKEGRGYIQVVKSGTKRSHQHYSLVYTTCKKTRTHHIFKQGDVLLFVSSYNDWANTVIVCDKRCMDMWKFGQRGKIRPLLRKMCRGIARRLEREP